MAIKRNHFCNSVTNGTKTDYPELTGIEIVFTSDDVGTHKGIIQGVNYDIGISIAYKDDPEDYLMCMAGPSSPEWSESENSCEDHNWSKIFYTTVDELQRGVCNNNWLLTIKDYNNYFSGMSNCSWSV